MRTGEQNEMKKIGIIGAMELEVEELKSRISELSNYRHLYFKIKDECCKNNKKSKYGIF